MLLKNGVERPESMRFGFPSNPCEENDDDGTHRTEQSQLFYAFNLDDRVPQSHLLRRIAPLNRLPDRVLSVRSRPLVRIEGRH
jgi:hypothetical protein